LNVEPHYLFFGALVAPRPRDVNLHVALADAPGEATFYEVPECIGWATLDEPSARKIQASGREVQPRTVPVMTLAEVCEQHVQGPIDFLKIDVEGAERAVLAGADFTRWRPRVLVIEATEAGSPVPTHEAWESLVLAADYLFATFDGLNRYYVRAEDRELLPVLQVPVNVFDDYVLAELVAEREEHQQARAEAERNRAEAERNRAEAERNRAEADLQHAEALRLSVELPQVHAWGDAGHRAAADLREQLDSAQSRVEELEQVANHLRRTYITYQADVAAKTVAKPAYEAAVRLLHQTRSHLEALRVEVIRQAG
jgi:FkbM family methyltransferase